MQSPELQAAQFAVEGHTDAKGSAKSNLKLSLERARAVAQLLISQGVSAERLQPTGKGTSDPADTANPYAAVNRRVRVVRLQE
jgi:outer membrane protein OmpA-like peptidoglycan-associated protein